MSFCLSTLMDKLFGMNQTKYLISPIIMIITIVTYACLSSGKNFFLDLFKFHKYDKLFSMV